MKRKIEKIALYFLFLSFLCGAAAKARADVAQTNTDDHAKRSPDRNRKTIVMLNEESASQEIEPLVRAVQGQMAEISIELMVHSTPSLPSKMSERVKIAEQIAHESSAVAVFWCDLESTDRVFLFLASPTGGRVLVRRLSGTSTAELEEAVAIIVRSSVEALLAGGEIGVKTKPKKIEQKETEPSDKKTFHPLFDMRASYAISSISNYFPAIHGAELSFGIRPYKQWAVRVGPRFSQMLERTERGFDISVERYPIFLGASFVGEIGRWTLGGIAALEIELARDQSVSTTQEAISREGGVEVGLGILIGFDVGFRLSKNIRIFLLPTAEIMLKKTDYVIAVGETTYTIIDTWTVRFIGLIGLEIAAF